MCFTKYLQEKIAKLKSKVVFDALADREEFSRETKINTDSRIDIIIVRLL